MTVGDVLALLKSGGPSAVAALALFALYHERKANKELQDKLLQLAMSEVESTTKMEGAIRSLRDVLDRVTR